VCESLSSSPPLSHPFSSSSTYSFLLLLLVFIPLLPFVDDAYPSLRHDHLAGVPTRGAALFLDGGRGGEAEMVEEGGVVVVVVWVGVMVVLGGGGEEVFLGVLGLGVHLAWLLWACGRVCVCVCL
jgi:hypothetical protein